MPDGPTPPEAPDSPGAAPEFLDYRDLLRLAHDKSERSRAALLTAISDLATDGTRLLTETDRALMRDIIANLIQDVELSVRQALAERLAAAPDVPRELVLCLAKDDIAVARPLLMKSAVLQDPDLIEIVQYRTMEHQVAIAMRPDLSEPVSDALVFTDNPDVIVTLLENDGARISDATLEALADRAAETPRYRKPLLDRSELPPAVARKLYWFVSAALRAYIVKNFDIDPAALDDTLESATEDTVRNAGDGPAAAAGAESAGRADDEPSPSESLNRLLNRGEIPQFVYLFAKLCGLRVELVRRILFEPGGEGMAIACKAIGLDKHDFASMFLRFRQGRLGDKQVPNDELAKAIEGFDRITPDNARIVMARWRRNPEYLNALRLVEES